MAKVTTSSISNVNLGQQQQNNNYLSVPSYAKNIFFVDPLDGLVVDNKELIMYVNLTATRKARTVLSISQSVIGSFGGNETEINLIGYREGKDGVRFMTTDWSTKPNLDKSTVPGTVTDLKNNGVFEGFGVQSIDISMIAMGPPSVTIKFIDTRGGGLFDQETFNASVAPINAIENNTSPYSIFFELPPPLFYLTIKGYYGNPVTLCLYLMKWSGVFNSENGNFEITAEFRGYTFAFLQDIKIGHLIGAGNTDAGREKLIEVSNIPTIEESLFPPITLSELALKFQRITVYREKEQKNSVEFNKLKVINEQLKYIKDLSKLLGSPASPNNNTSIYGTTLDKSFLKYGTEQIFFRDIGLIAKTNDNSVQEKYANLIKKTDELLTKYKDFRGGYSVDFYEQGFITMDDLGLKKQLDDDVLWKPGITQTLNEVNRLIKENEPEVEIPIVTVKDFSGATKNNWPLDSDFYILNLKIARKNIKTKLDNLTKYKKLLELNIQKKFDKEISDILGFKPTIRNIIGILCNNIEMYLTLIHNVATRAEGLKSERYDLLKNNGFTSDSPLTEKVVYAFPKVIDNNLKEVYLEAITGIDETTFPEIDFINDLINGLVYSLDQQKLFNESEGATQQISILEPFPINTVDVGNNPYVGLDGLPFQLSDPPSAVGDLNTLIVEAIVKRPFIANCLSKYNATTNDNLYKIAELEALNFYDTIESQRYRDAIKQITSQNLLNLALKYGIIKESTIDPNKYDFRNVLIDKSFEIDSAGTASSGVRLWDRDLNLKEKIAESLKLSQNDNTEIDKFKSYKRDTTYIKRFFDNTNVYLNKSYLTLATFKYDSVKNSILEGNSLGNGNLLEIYSMNKLRTIPVSQNLYFYVPPTATNILTKTFTNSSIYLDTVNEYGKGYLILSSLLFNDEKVLFDEIKDDYTKIIRLPKYYLLWLGANAYRNNSQTEILSFNIEFPSVPKNQYYYVTEKLGSGDSNNILNNYFEKLFKEWVESEEFFLVRNYFEKLFTLENLDENTKKKITDNLNQLIFVEYDLNIIDSTRMLTNSVDESIDKTKLETYLNKFFTSYGNVYEPDGGKVLEEKPPRDVTNITNDNDIKLGFYVSVKQAYDNWIAGNTDDVVYACCKTLAQKKAGAGRRFKLFDLFKFVDKFRNATAGDAIMNINSFNDLYLQKDTAMFAFICKLLTDSNFMYFNIPIYLEFNKASEVKSAFEPQTNFNRLQSSPSLLCVYNGPTSTAVASNSNYADDSFKFDGVGDASAPNAVYEKKEKQVDTPLVAFDVKYGSQFQSMFKSVAVSTQESSSTEESITLLVNYSTGTGVSKPALKDNSFFPIFRNRSYTATVQMMGNMMIQPQMYFQLSNIPFFSGAYMVMNVSHRVEPNNIVTTFRGVRQNRNPVTIITEPTSFLNFKFDQGISSGTTILENSVTQDLSQIEKDQNKNKNIADTAQDIIPKYEPTIGLNILRTFNDTPDDKHYGIDIQVNSSNDRITTVNNGGRVLYYLIGDENTRGKLIVEHTEEINGEIYYYYTGYFNIEGNLGFVKDQEILPKTFVGSPSKFVNITRENNVTKEETFYYYHYEILRSKFQLTSFEEYQTYYSIERLNPQQFAPKLGIKLLNKALHDNKIYDENKDTADSDNILIGEYNADNEILVVNVDPNKGKWEISDFVYINFDIIPPCEGKYFSPDPNEKPGLLRNTFDNFLSPDKQTAIIPKYQLLSNVGCLNAPIEEKTGEYKFSVKLTAYPLNPNGSINVNKDPYRKTFTVQFTI